MKRILTVSLLFLSTAAFAQQDETREADSQIEATQESSRVIKYRQVTEVEFGDGLDIDGELVGPNGDIYIERKRGVFNPMIQLRTDFNAEMAESVNDVR